MNVLMISLDATAAMEPADIIGDFPERLVEYGKHVSKIFVIARSLRKMHLKPKKLGNNVFIYPTSSHGILLSIFSTLDTYRIASRIIKREKIDVITTQDPFFAGLAGYLLKKRYGIPLSVELHADYLDNKFWLGESKLNHLRNWLGKFIVKRADAIRDTTAGRIGDYLKNKLSIDASKIAASPFFANVRDFIEFNPSYVIRKKYSNYENMVLFTGRLAKQKNIPNLLKAVPEVLAGYPKTLFLIVGDGEERAKLEEMVRKMGIEQSVVFEGSVAHQVIYEYFYSCDMFVLPSNYEGIAWVRVEALACGKPVISTDVGAAHEVVTDGETGYIVPLDTPQALAQKIVYLLENPELRERMGKRGQQLVKEENRDIKQNAYKYRELFEKAIVNAKR